MDRALVDNRIALGNRCARGRLRVALALIALGAPGAAHTAEPSAAIIAGAPRQATPAMWEVRDGDTIIYLFGTFHTLDEGTAWFDRSVRSAFDRSGELVLETIVPTDPRQISAIGRAVACPRPTANGFLAATRATVERARARGLTVDHGAESVLRRAAAGQGKSLSGIEHFADQLRTLTLISKARAVPAPATVTATVTLDALLAAWKAGDTHAFTLMLAGFKAKAPTAYRMLITERNALYGEWIAQRLDHPGTVFVAVGSGHLAGRDSVQNWLLAKGIHARRVS